jgi:hypothetical protein
VETGLDGGPVTGGEGKESGEGRGAAAATFAARLANPVRHAVVRRSHVPFIPPHFSVVGYYYVLCSHG